VYVRHDNDDVRFG